MSAPEVPCVLALPLATFPPWHPIFVNFTAALVPISFFFDLLALVYNKTVMRAVAWWTLLAAACLTPLTVAFGWIWMYSGMGEGHWQLPIHLWLGTSFGLVLILLAVWRGAAYRRQVAPSRWYGLAAVLMLLALLVQGDLGASMSFESGIVFSSHEHHTESPGEHHTSEPSAMEQDGGAKTK
jgi:uncharacterized membrane protein